MNLWTRRMQEATVLRRRCTVGIERCTVAERASEGLAARVELVVRTIHVIDMILHRIPPILNP